MPTSGRRDVVFILTRDEVLACAVELGIPPERITDDVIRLVERRVRSGLRHWPEIMRNALREGLNCPLGQDCYRSCAWWKNDKCAFPAKSNKKGRERPDE